MKLRCHRRCCRGEFQKGQHIEVFEGKEYHVACAASERREHKERQLKKAAKRRGQKPLAQIPWFVFLVCPLLYWQPQH